VGKESNPQVVGTTRGQKKSGWARKTVWHSRGIAGRLSALALALPVAAGLSFAQAPGFYRIDLQASHIEMQVFRSGFLSVLGDNHLIALSRFSGTAEDSGEKPWSVHVLADAGSLEVRDPGVSVSTRQEVQKTMLGPTQLEVTRYPVIELRSHSLLAASPGKSWRMFAEVTLHGVTRQEEFPLTWSQEGDKLRVWGKKDLRLRDFKIEPIRKALGAVKVGNEFELVYDITLRRER